MQAFFKFIDINIIVTTADATSAWLLGSHEIHLIWTCEFSFPEFADAKIFDVS